MKKLLFLLAACVALGACCRAGLQKTGSDRDAYGCIASAGYTWSQVAGDCLRLWEAGVRLQNVQEPDATAAAYAVISADGSQVELFMPQQEPVVMQRSFTPDGPVWKKGAFRLERMPDGWFLYQGNNLIYQAGNPPDSSR